MARQVSCASRRRASVFREWDDVVAAKDIASAIEWMLDPANACVSGQVLGTDGGLASLRARRRLQHVSVARNEPWNRRRMTT